MRIKQWFLDKEFTQNEKYVIECGTASIERETEKAYLLKWNSDYGYITRWVPKSCICTEEEINNTIDRLTRGINYNELLVQYAKDNNIKGVRIGLKTKTLINKIRSAGLEVPARG